jgi:hypothetical protein
MVAISKSGLGHQVAEDLKTLQVVKSTLEDAGMQLGLRSKHIQLQNLINAAIEEAASLTVASDDYLQSFE